MPQPSDQTSLFERQTPASPELSRLAKDAILETHGGPKPEKQTVTLSTPSEISQGLNWRKDLDQKEQVASKSFGLADKYNQLIATSAVQRQPGESKSTGDTKNLSIFKPVEMQLYFGVNHGHSVYSDGLSLPQDLYQKAIDDGIQFLFITEHNHWKCRMGVEDEDRKSAESQYKTVAENPQVYFDEIAMANKLNRDHKGTFVAGVGVESGTIGKPGSNHEGGVNHFAVFESPKFIRAGVDGQDDETAGDSPSSSSSLNTQSVPDLPKSDKVIDYPDGNTANLVDQLEKLGSDSTGGQFVIDLCHPRFAKDFLDPKNNNPGRDYGIQSFPSQQDWVNKFGRYVSMVEVIKGEALNPNPVSHMKPADCDPRSFAGYIHMGIKAGPVVGRDFHFDDPGARPAYTGVLANRLDMNSVLEALRERRTIATTNMQELQAIVTADDDKYVMGNILSESQAKDLNLKVKIGGKVDANAEYTVKLFADTTIGDGNLKEAVDKKPVQTIKLTGSDLESKNDEVTFASEEISALIDAKQNSREKLNAALWVEVDKSSPNKPADDEESPPEKAGRGAHPRRAELTEAKVAGRTSGADEDDDKDELSDNESDEAASGKDLERCWTAPIFIDKAPAMTPESTMQPGGNAKNLYELHTSLSNSKPYFKPAA